MITTFIQAKTGSETAMQVLAMLIAFANGLVVGSSLVSFLAIIGFVPRLAEVTHTERGLRYYDMTLICGATLAALAAGFIINLHLPALFTMLPGACMGLFVGCLAAALAEVLNVLPVIARRVGLLTYIRLLLMAIILGKVAGSLLYWLVPGF